MMRFWCPERVQPLAQRIRNWFGTGVHGLVALGMCAGALALPALTAPLLAAEAGENYLLPALPAANEMVIDGDLKDWDLSGVIFSCYDPETMKDNHAVTTAAAYDAKGLYLAFHFKDGTPLTNKVDPVNEPACGWRGDCVQLRIWADSEKPVGPQGGRLAHIDAYYFAPGKQPVAYLQYNDMSKREDGLEGKIPQAVGQGIDMAFRPDADGKGYVQEMRIDWKLLRRDGRPYKAGESLRMGMEFLWGSATNPSWPEHRYADLINEKNPQREFFWVSNNAWGEVRFLDKGNVAPSASVAALSALEQRLKQKYETAGVVEIPYELPEAKRVTLVVEKPDGTRVRNLISDYPREAGRNADYWDGCDDKGVLVPAGEYRVRGLSRGEYDLRYQFAYGTPGTPPWETADGRGDWLSDHVRPASVASDGAWTYLSHHMSEGGSTVIGLDETGQKRWGIGRIAGGPVAVIDGALYMLTGGGHPTDWGAVAGELHLLKMDARQGKFANFADNKSDHLIAKFEDNRVFPVREYLGAITEKKAFDADWLQREMLGLAAAGGQLYASLFYENKVLQIDPVSGTTVQEFPLERPAGIAAAKDGTLYVVSGKQVLRRGKDGAFVPFLREGLAAPVALACDAAGNVYVSDWADQMCVKVFSAEGKFLRTVGKLGGRALEGAYDAGGMFLPIALAVDGKNRLWAAEFDYQPKRYSVWNADGQLEREFCGPTWYGATECNVNALNPKQAFCMGNIVDLDWQRGQWRVAATLWRPTRANALFGPLGEHGILNAYQINGKQYLAYTRSSAFFCVAQLLSDRAKPLMARGYIADLMGGMSNGWNRIFPAVADKLWDDPAQLEWAKKKFPGVFAGGVPHVHQQFYRMATEAKNLGKPMRTQFLWIDQNGDGLVDDPELKLFTPEEANGLNFMGYWRIGNDAQLTQYFCAEKKNAGGGKPDLQVWRWPVRSWNACGAPVYDLADAKLIATRPTDGIGSTVPWADDKGISVMNVDPLMAFGPDGKELWSYPNHWNGVHGSHTAPKDHNGLLIGPLKVIGAVDAGAEAGELFCLNGNMGKAFLFTIDGLYAGSLLRDCRSAPDALPERPERGGSIMRTSAGSEWFGGEFFRNALDGKVYLGTAARNGQLLSEVTGLETIRRLPTQTITLTPAQLVKAGEQLAARKSAEGRERRLLVYPLQQKAEGAPAAGAFVWKDCAKWNYDEDHAAEAAMAYDNNNLYVCFNNVKDATPMINNGKLPTRLFKTGDAALLELRVHPDDQRPEIQPGDLRLLFSVFEGKPRAVLYRYKALAGETPQPEEFASPVQTVKVEVVKVLDGAAIAVDRKPGGYTLRAAVALKDLGFAPQNGRSYRADFGIVYSNAAGTLNELRMNWANADTGLVADLPGETLIRPANWGSIVIKAKP